MVYGSAELTGVPWEVAVKLFRGHVGKAQFGTLKECYEAFVHFLEASAPLFPAQEQERYFLASLRGYYGEMQREIDQQVQEVLKKEHKIEVSRVQQIVSEVCRRHRDQWEKVDRLPSIPEDHSQQVIEKHRTQIQKAAEDVFKQLPISEATREDILYIAGALFAKKRFPPNCPGVVLAGFGEQDIYPKLITLVAQGLVSNRLKYSEEPETEIGPTNNAVIHAFAQKEAAVAFIEGIHPHLNQVLKGYLSKLFDSYPAKIVSAVSGLETDVKNTLDVKLREAGTVVLNDFWQSLDAYKQERHIGPLLDAVAALPKDELAVMAETLVNLTSFKQRVSMDMETVGGPIDVAVISKGDGFIWIKRKHYFDAAVNPQFMAKYHRHPTTQEETKQ